MPPLRAAIVAAVSDPKQAAADKASIPDQIKDSRRLCEVRDWTPAAEVIIPGHSRNYNWLHEIVRDCPEYGEMIDLIEAGAVDLIVCRDYDRLWRTDALRAQVTALCREHGVQVY
ncbi:MAG: recombinase family protein, partial [Chloroflexi bacterium]|nr:recombinase family protein [Chloroflexota bacterium]